MNRTGRKKSAIAISPAAGRMLVALNNGDYWYILAIAASKAKIKVNLATAYANRLESCGFIESKYERRGSKNTTRHYRWVRLTEIGELARKLFLKMYPKT